MYKKNLFITGAPQSGKTTVIKKIITALTMPAQGFYTEEERVGDKRVGFVLHTLDGKSGYLAHEDIISEFHIRRYGVSIENIESIAIPSIQPKNHELIILDEIGKMECFSSTFQKACVEALDSPNIVVGTITFGGGPFIEEIKKRPDFLLFEVTLENRNELPAHILRLIHETAAQ